MNLLPVVTYANRFLDEAADRFGAATPLLANYLDPKTRLPLRMEDGAGGELILSNIAGQLNFIRVLHALSVLRDDPAPRDRALAILRFGLRNARRRGMILWGNHAGIDLLTKKPVFLGHKGKVHELKAHYPPYDLMWEADPAELTSMIAYYWHGHMYDWSRLDLSRHGRMDLPDYALPADPWGAPYAGGDVFFIGGGLTFINAGSDLYLAAAELSRLTGHAGALHWSERLMRRYDETRHPRTGLTGYQYSSIFDKFDPEKKRSADRAWVQFKDQFPDHHPHEGRLTGAGRMRLIIGQSVLCRLHIARTLGSAGAAFAGSAVADAEAYAAWSYDFGSNVFHPLFTDGFRLTGHVIARDGYFGKAGQVFETKPADGLLFWSFLAAWRVSRSTLLWTVARNIGFHLGLGDIGLQPGAPRLAPREVPDPTPVCFGLLELDTEFPGAGYLGAAAGLAERMCKDLERADFPASSPAEPALNIDRVEPLAILHVAARLAGRSAAMLPFFSHAGLDTFSGWIREDSAPALA